MFLRFIAIFALLNLLVACEFEATTDDLMEAKVAMESREWIYAERLLERYLNVEENADKRWEAWQALIALSEHTGAHAEIVRLYYENMLQEFLDDAQRKKIVLYDLAQLLAEIKDFESAIDTWTVYLGLNDLSTEEVYDATRHTIEIYLHTGQFEAAENSLYNCLGLEISPQDSAICLYELADLKAERGALQEAKDLATQVLEMDVYPLTRGQATFLLGDIAEQEEDYTKAQSFFEQSKEFYPNPLVVESRIAQLASLIKK